MLEVTNRNNSVTNLGTKKGRMLSFKPKETKVIDDEMCALFASELEYYEQGGFISVRKNQTTQKIKEIVTPRTPNVNKNTRK